MKEKERVKLLCTWPNRSDGPAYCAIERRKIDLPCCSSYDTYQSVIHRGEL
jgi:hypothetical protein